MRIGPIAVRTSLSTLLAGRFHHPPHLPVPSLRDRHLEERVLGAVPQPPHFRRGGHSIAQLDALPQLFQLFVAQ